jgi:uncharacterized protein involved in exopolysaccharide biosynthesis
MINQGQDTGSLRDFLNVIFKNKAKILTIFATTVVTVTLGSFLVSPVYEAKSSLLVKFGREYIYRPEVGDRSPMVSINQDEAINSELNILTSRDLIEKVITTLKVENIYPDLAESPPSAMTTLQAAIIRFEKKLNAEIIKKSNVIEIAFQHKDPQIAANAVNLLIDFYKEKHLEVHSGAQSSFLEKQLIEYDQKLKQSESDLEAFKQKHRVFSLDEQRSLLLKQRMELDTSLKNSSNNVNELEKKLSSLQAQMKVISNNKGRYTNTERDKIIVDARAKLLDLRLKEQDLLQKYNESNRLIINVRKEIKLVADFLSQQEADITSKVMTGNAVYQEAEKETLITKADLESQLAKYRDLRLQLGQVDREIQSLDLKEKEIKGLNREVSNNDKSYRMYVDKVEEARISDDMNRQKMSNVSVIQAATPPAKPIKPKKALNMVLGIILGVVSGLGYAFFSEYASQGLSTPESVEKRLGLPVLTTISYKH